MLPQNFLWNGLTLRFRHRCRFRLGLVCSFGLWRGVSTQAIVRYVIHLAFLAYITAADLLNDDSWLLTARCAVLRRLRHAQLALILNFCGPIWLIRRHLEERVKSAKCTPELLNCSEHLGITLLKVCRPHVLQALHRLK